MIGSYRTNFFGSQTETENVGSSEASDTHIQHRCTEFSSLELKLRDELQGLRKEALGTGIFGFETGPQHKSGNFEMFEFSD